MQHLWIPLSLLSVASGLSPAWTSPFVRGPATRCDRTLFECISTSIPSNEPKPETRAFASSWQFQLPQTPSPPHMDPLMAGGGARNLAQA